MGRRSVSGESVRYYEYYICFSSPPARSKNWRRHVGDREGVFIINQLRFKFNIKELEVKRRKLRNNMTHAEVLLWNYIRRKQILKIRFRRQFSIEQFIVDFYAPQLMLAIEVDGMTHLIEEDIEYDNWRQNKLEEYGVKFLRFTNVDVYDNIDGVVKTIYCETERLLKLIK